MKGRADLLLAAVALTTAFSCVTSQVELDVTELVTPPVEVTAAITTEFTPVNATIVAACVYSDYSTTCECDSSAASGGGTANVCGFYRNFTCDGEEMRAEYTYNLSAAQCLVQAEWSDWTSWSGCRDACSGGGWKNRSRVCHGPTMQFWQNVVPCNGSDVGEPHVESELCACGEWSEWGEYSTCSATCGGGIQTRERDCIAAGRELLATDAVCNGSSNDTAACGTDECALSQDELDNCLYVVLETNVTIDDYYLKLRPGLWPASVHAANAYCSNSSNFGTCCPGKAAWSLSGVLEYVTMTTMYWPGGFSDGSRLYISLCMFPDIDHNELCNAPAPSGGRKRAVTFATNVASAVANSQSLSSTILSTAAASGISVAVLPPVSTSVAASAKAASASAHGNGTAGTAVTTTTTTIAAAIIPAGTAATTSTTTRTTIAITAGPPAVAAVTISAVSTNATATATGDASSTRAAAATIAASTAAPAQPLGLIVGVSVGGGLGLLAIILIIAIVWKKKMASTGMAKITQDAQEHQHHENERRRGTLMGSVANATPQTSVALSYVQQQ